MRKSLSSETIQRYKANRGEIWRTEEGLHFTFSENLKKAGQIWKKLKEDIKQVA